MTKLSKTKSLKLTVNPKEQKTQGLPITLSQVCPSRLLQARFTMYITRSEPRPRDKQYLL
jgi:hypothetical protein